MISHGGPELFVVFVIAIITPILYRLVLKRHQLWVRIASITALWVVAMVVAYWDVYQISREARRLCREEAGLHVFRTVEAEGFLGDISIDYWAKYGFRYVESPYRGNKTRFTMNEGKVTSESILDYVSRYEYARDTRALEAPFEREQDMIRDRQTGETLGDIVAFYVYPGWLDSRLLGLLGFAWSPPRCDEDYKPKPQKATLYYTDLVKAVIKPKQDE